VCIERPRRIAAAEAIIQARTKTNITGRSSPLSTNPFLATLAVRIEPGAPGSGVDVRFDVEPRLVPLYLFKSPDVFAAHLTAYVHDGLREGLAGWQVTDCRVTVTDSGYVSPVTTAADYRHVTELVLATALQRAGTWVCEPLSDLALEIPTASAPGVTAALGRLGGRVTGQSSANGQTRASAELPLARVRSLQHQLPGLSKGEGILEQRLGGYQPVGGDDPPRRPRTRPSPLERAAWLASLAKRG
jgi:ribosomal protection tetracycline resistance protein